MSNVFNAIKYFPVLLLDPDERAADKLALNLSEAGFTVHIADTAAMATEALQRTYYSTLIIMADFENAECAARIVECRRAAEKTWIIVACPSGDEDARAYVHRLGGDACIFSPPSLPDLLFRLDTFQRRTRPTL